MKLFQVTLPIAGHVYVEVEAETEASAIEKALEAPLSLADADWEVLKEFNRGNICNCPSPWEAKAEEI